MTRVTDMWRARGTLFPRLTRAIVVVAAAVALLSLQPGHGVTATASDTKAIRVTSSKLIVDAHSRQPKVVLSMYEDFLCPYCGRFERDFGSTVAKLIDTGAVAADYYFVAILDRGDRDYSSRAGAAAYCVADQSTDAFQRFHAALFAQQPDESASSFPDNSALIDSAQQAGAANAANCINNDTYIATVKGMAQAANITGTPTVRINGQDYALTTPDDLVAKITSIVGNVPGLAMAPPSTTPTNAPGTTTTV